jgi:hypothetical protein
MNWREILTVLIMALGVFASGVLIGYGRGGGGALGLREEPNADALRDLPSADGKDLGRVCDPMKKREATWYVFCALVVVGSVAMLARAQEYPPLPAPLVTPERIMES